MYVPLKNYSVMTKFVLPIITGHTYAVFFKKKLTSVLIYSLAKSFLEGLKDSCFENIVISTERCP